jgi:hypothetical protein
MDTRTLLRHVRIRLLNVIFQKNGVLVRSCLSLWVEAFAFLVVTLWQYECSRNWFRARPRYSKRSHTFSHNFVVKIGWFQTTHFGQKKRHNEGNVCDKYKIWKTTFKLRRRHFLFNCRRGVCVVTAVSIITGGAPTSWRRLQKSQYRSLWRENQKIFSTPSESAYSKQATPWFLV